MNKRYYVVSDLHLHHERLCTFTFKDSDRLIRRHPFTDSGFTDIEDHDQFIIQQWNDTVSAGDTVYVLGDVVINRKGLYKLDLLNGRKILVPGNHDIFHIDDYRNHFADVRGYIVRNEVIFSHIPVYSGQLEHRFKLNCHGHTHQNLVMMKKNGADISDPRYMNVCYEQLKDYKPISIDEVYAYRDRVR
jgi:calcineurin-like phosphoesterase family protein